jgi:hypothetical protein
MERHRQLDDPEACTEVAAGDRHRRDRLGAQLVGQLAEPFGRQAAQIGRQADRVEQGCGGAVGHGALSVLPGVAS